MFIKRLTLRKLLSFNDASVELGPLNVLIGPNAVGKSNLIEAISLLQAAPTGFGSAILRGGGIRKWLWLGDRGPLPVAVIECQLRLSTGLTSPLLYQLRFTEQNGGPVIVGECLGRTQEFEYFRRSYGTADLGRPLGIVERRKTGRTPVPIQAPESVLSQLKNPLDTTPITQVGRHFEQMRIFREFRTGAASPARLGISTSAAKEVLSDGGDNLALVLNKLDVANVHARIQKYLRRFCERFEDVKVDVGEGLARILLREAGMAEMLSGIRMSDGTLKFLALLAALFDPQPPPLVCIEEPEIGLHPDALQLVAGALVEASESTQLIVTTHSEALVDALTGRPEAVLVCERGFDNGTEMRRLSAKALKLWLERYTLGELWRKGEIGGGRW